MDIRSQIEVEILDSIEDTGVVLGQGSFGVVKVVRLYGKEHAGKFFYKNLISDGTMYEKCLKECKQAFNIKHQNIVQTIGVYSKQANSSLVLVMEKLPYCLQEFVCLQERNLPDYIKLRILHDVTRGLSFLHHMNIMHRDLAAKNILLAKNLTAKIADFGQSKLVPPTVVAMERTPAPGTSVYMPPEALNFIYDKNGKQVSLAEYNFSIDSFSFGVLMLHIFLREHPQPSGHFMAIGEVLRQRPPLDYFRDDIEKAIPEGHALRGLLEECLQLEPSKRPNADTLVSRTQELLDSHDSYFKELLNYAETYPALEHERQKLQTQLEERRGEVDRLNKELVLQGEEMIKLKEQWKKLNGMVDNYRQKVRSQSVPEDGDYVFVETTQLSSLQQSARSPLLSISNLVKDSLKESMAKEIQEKHVLWEENVLLRSENEQLKREVKQLREEASQRNDVTQSLPGDSVLLQSMRSMRSVSLFPETQEHIVPATVKYTEQDVREFVDDNKTLSIRDIARCDHPFGHIEGAKAVLIQGKLYMGRATNTVLSYNRFSEKWEKLPPAPIKNYALASYNGQLVLVGGSNQNNVISNNVYCFVDNAWSKDVIRPCLKIPRENAVAVGFGKYLIVVGGVTVKAKFFTNILDSVEVYCSSSNKWFDGPKIPRQGFVLQCISADDYLYILNPDGWTVRYCALDELVNAAVRGTNNMEVWHSINSHVPYSRCSLAVYKNTLFVVAGAGSDGNVYAFYPKDKRWRKVATIGVHLPAIKNASCVLVSDSELFVCGGDIELMNRTAKAGYLLEVEEPAPCEGSTAGEGSASTNSGTRSGSRSHSGGSN